MAEELQDKDAPNEEAMDVAVDIERKIHNAMRSRISHFKEQADSLTFEGVRRLLEKDLCLEKYALDVHKRYVKQCLVKCLESAEEDNASKDSEEIGRKSASKGEAAESLEGHQSEKDVNEPCVEYENMEDSPVMGLLTGRKTKNVESDGIKGTKDKDDKDIPSESTITEAIRKRTSYLKANSEKVTMAGVRRLLEDDLKLTTKALDSCKKFISQQVEKILTSCEAAEQVSNEKKGSCLKTPKKVSKESSHSTEGSSSEEENDEVKPGKKNATKGRIPNSNETKKRKRSTMETVSAKKQSKHVQQTSEEDSDGGGENGSEDGQSDSSNEKPVKKEVSTPVYGKRVEHLKSVIKSCGMSVPPAIYKKGFYPAMAAACGSLQHIFENPLPESPTLLETLSSWNQIMPLKPTDHSSFTEIFGELHFKESFVPHSFSSLSSLTESNSPSSNDLWKEPSSNGEHECSSFHRKSNSFSSTNSESLQLCTEGLGYESLDDVEDLKGGMDGEEWQREDEGERSLNKQIQYPNLKPGMICRTKTANMEDFPPPISCMGKSGKPWVGFKSYRYGGRFILKEVRVPTHEFLHASRENGRLKLHILVSNEQTRETKEEDNDGNNKNNHENTIGKCKVETRP